MYAIRICYFIIQGEIIFILKQNILKQILKIFFNILKQNIEMLKEMKEMGSFKGHHPALGKGSMPPPALGREARSDFRESVGGIARAAVPSQLRKQFQNLNAALQLTSCGLAEILPAF